MSGLGNGEITRLLNGLRQGEPGAEAVLVELVYDRLYALARNTQFDGSKALTLGPTSLVNEAYLRLSADAAWESFPNSRYFFAAAATAMRQLVVDHARRSQTRKRGGGRKRVSLDDLLHYYQRDDLDLLTLDEAIDKLQAVDCRKADVVKLRFFVGLTMPEVAKQLDVSLRTVETDWRVARAFLKAHLSDD